MAADMIASAREMDAKIPSTSAEGEASEQMSGAGAERSTPSTMATLAAPAATSAPAEVEYVLFSYFCAGSGGVGDTILASSYMLCGEQVVYWDGRASPMLLAASRAAVRPNTQAVSGRVDNVARNWLTI